MSLFRRSSKSALFILLLAGALVGLGCASTGGSADSPTGAAATPDYTQEMGANGLPTPRALLARYVEALGGEEAIRDVEYTTMKGKMMMPAMGMEGDLVLHTKAPNMMTMNVELGGFGSMNTGFNGVHGWSDNPMTGPQLLDGKMLSDMKRQADFYSEFNYEENYPEQETLEEVEFEGQQTYKVRLVDTDGSESFQYFATDSNLLVGVQGKQSSEMGEMDVTTVMGSYEQHGDIKLPTTMNIKMMGMEIQQTFEEVSFEPIDDATFDPPEAIQKLIDSE